MNHGICSSLVLWPYAPVHNLDIKYRAGFVIQTGPVTPVNWSIDLKRQAIKKPAQRLPKRAFEFPRFSCIF
jgi:hypothetical protein